MIRYLLIFSLTCAVAFATLLPLRSLHPRDFASLMRMAINPGRVAMFGDSVIGTFSRCDLDKASIPEMLGRALQEPVANGARDGGSLGISLDKARAITAVRRFDVVVLPVTQDTLFRSVRTGSAQQRFWADFLTSLTYAPKPAPVRTPFKGRVYGGYEENAALYFTKEKAAMACPENAGKDLAFVEYMYWNAYSQAADLDAGFPYFLAQVSRLEQRGITVLAVLPPVNYQLIERLNDPSVMESLRRRTAETEQQLQSANVKVLNITFALPTEAFADQWCACGHLNEAGRKEYALRVAGKVRALLSSGAKT